MGLEILSARDFSVKLKCAIHVTGKLGFASSAAEALGLSVETAVKFARDEKQTLYAIIVNADDPDAFKVNKAGDYFYVSAKGLFDKLNYDYVNMSYIFDMIKVEDEESPTYKLIKREKPRKSKKEE